MSAYWPFVLIGLFSGSVYALAAMGVVLTYKTSGIFNFAYGAIAMFCGFTFWQLRDGWHLTQWVALPVLLLLVAPLIGLICERLFRPVIALSAEIQIVMTFGVVAVLQSLAPILYGGKDRSLRSIFPTSTFSVGHQLNVSYTQLFTLILTVAVGIGLSQLLQRTRFGLSTRAVVDNRDLAELNGVSSDGVSRIAWMISCMFAGLVGILLSSSQGLDVYTLVLVVIYAFAPAVLGKLVSLPLAFGGAMVLGVAQSLLSKWGSSGTVADIEASLPYIALFALLLFYGRGLKEVRSSIRSVTASAPTGGWARAAVTAGALLLVGLLLPIGVHGSGLRDISSGLVYAAIAVTLVVLTGWAGQISLAQFSFVGVGAFAAGHLGGAHGDGFLWAAVVGALIAVPLGVIVGLPSIRLSGLFLALATMAFALLLDNLVFIRGSISGGYTGLTVSRPRIFGISFVSDLSFYYLALGLFAVYGIGATLLRRGPIGRRLQMIRDAPLGASTFGVNLTLTKLVVFAVCGAAAAFAGAFFGALRLTVDPNDFAFQQSLQLLLLVVLGGRALVGGALIAGGISTFELLPLAASINRYIPLGVGIGVVSLAQYPEGPISITMATLRYYTDIFRRRPVRDPKVLRVSSASLGRPASNGTDPSVDGNGRADARATEPARAR
ncbi:MAG TPA: ABC transporter permease [Acidimicrobiales bacterium]|nr:ABC transporter permease [Acidimicrobiales bacterium]